MIIILIKKLNKSLPIFLKKTVKKYIKKVKKNV